MRIRLTGYAASEVEIRAEFRCEYDPEEVQALFAAWDGEAVTVTDDNAQAVAAGLNTLSNWCDCISTEKSISAEERRANWHASQGLATAFRRAASFAADRPL